MVARPRIGTPFSISEEADCESLAQLVRCYSIINPTFVVSSFRPVAEVMPVREPKCKAKTDHQPFQDSEFMFTRKDAGLVRVVTTPVARKAKWFLCTRRTTIDMESDCMIANEIVRGLSKSALYRALPR